jgi:phage-related protein
MTGKEYSILDEIRADIKQLLKSEATSIERAKHCAARFGEIEKDRDHDNIVTRGELSRVEKLAQWSRTKILIATGAVLASGFIAGVLVKVL